MDSTIALFLLQDGVVNGAVYALVGIALVLVFSVTRVILVPQGEFVAFSAMTVAALEAGALPATGGLLLGLGVAAAAATIVQERRELSARRLGWIGLVNLGVPAALLVLLHYAAAQKPGPVAAALLACALITPMGPMLYRIAFAPLIQSSVLVLLIAAFGVHFFLVGLGLAFFGSEGIRTTSLVPGSLQAGTLVITGQSLVVVSSAVVILLLFAWLFARTLLGKALRACSSNRLGARLVGIPTVLAGEAAFALAAGMGAIAGVLIGPIQTIFYDSGFLIGLKAFVAAIFGGLASFALTVVGSVFLGVLEALFSFLASAFKEALVFLMMIPVLVWLSLRSTPHPEEEE